MSHITEIIYQSIYKKNLGTDSLHNTNYDNFKLYYNFKEESKLMSQVIDLISTVRRLKTESQISLKTSIKELTIYSTNEKLKNLEKLILGITKAEKINFIRQSGPTEIKENNSEYFLFINI